MKTSNVTVKIDKEALRDLYRCHGPQSSRFNYTLEEFQDIVEGYLEPYAEFLFDILPQCPRLHQDYYDALNDAHLLQINAFAQMYHAEPLVKHPRVTPNTLPDIKIERTAHHQSTISTFNDKLPHIYTITENAVQHFWDNFTLEEMRALGDKDQARLVALFDTFDITHHRKPGQHLKLVYGLHLPQELLDFNTNNLKKLAARIIMDEDFHDGLACFLDEGHSKELGLPYIEHEEDKRRLTNIFMNVMAQIWQIPDPVEENYNKEPTLDKSGEKFTEFMHAYYVAAANDNDPGKKTGLIYGANTHNGYLSGDRRYAVKALSHEFGHLLSNFIVSAHANSALIKAQPRRDEIQNAAVLSLNDSRNILSTNNMYALHGRYYSATTTVFNGLSTSKSDHIYKGQLEERHADWLGNKTMEYIDFALENRDYIDDFNDIKRVVSNKFKIIMSHIGPDENAPALFKEIIEDLQYTKDFNELEHYTKQMRGALQIWFSDNFKRTHPDNASNDNNAHALPNRKQLINAYQAYMRLKKFCDTFYDVRKIVQDYGYEMQPAAQNTLTPE